MSERITKKRINTRIDLLNKITGNPLTAYTVNESNKPVANIGHYYASHAYGGYQLEQITNTGGGCRDVTRGRKSTREFYDVLNAYIQALEDMKYGRLNG